MDPKIEKLKLCLAKEHIPQKSICIHWAPIPSPSFLFFFISLNKINTQTSLLEPLLVLKINILPLLIIAESENSHCLNIQDSGA